MTVMALICHLAGKGRIENRAAVSETSARKIVTMAP